MSRRRLTLLLVGFIWSLGETPGWAQPPVPTEHDVKAAFIYNFLRFVEWPEDRFETAGSPFRVCVVGTDPFGSSLERAFADRRISDRAVETHYHPGTVTDSPCHVVFVGVPTPSDDAPLAPATTGILTVGEGRAFAQTRGIIGLYVKDRKVRFTINVSRADEAGLRISSHLLNLADIVDGGEASDRDAR